MATESTQNIAVVTGAAGQDGWFLVRRLAAEGMRVIAVVRRPLRCDYFGDGKIEELIGDLSDPDPFLRTIAELRPAEIYNLGGESSVSRSFNSPDGTWKSNADFVLRLLETVRCHTPESRLYQASSTDMLATDPVTHRVDEQSPMRPQSPYAVAKAAAHLLVGAYRAAYGLRIACGILSNHESYRRGSSFLTRKIVDHVKRLKHTGDRGPLVVGNVHVRRDWGYAPEYVDGIHMILHQIEVRGDGEEDTGHNYRDYILATGRSHAVWQLIDRAYALAGFELQWQLESPDPRDWHALYRDDGKVAVQVDPLLFRPADPIAIEPDPGRANRELGWHARADLDLLLTDMLGSNGE